MVLRWKMERMRISKPSGLTMTMLVNVKIIWWWQNLWKLKKEKFWIHFVKINSKIINAGENIKEYGCIFSLHSMICCISYAEYEIKAIQKGNGVMVGPLSAATKFSPIWVWQRTVLRTDSFFNQWYFSNWDSNWDYLEPKKEKMWWAWKRWLWFNTTGTAIAKTCLWIEEGNKIGWKREPKIENYHLVTITWLWWNKWWSWNYTEKINAGKDRTDFVNWAGFPPILGLVG